jgi:NAD(P)-dependent dehydrogenase (short-subunit alcohol dehydrogenase family)
MSVWLKYTVCDISGAGESIGGSTTRRYAREGARAFLVGRTQSKRNQVVDEWLRPAQPKARFAIRLVQGCTATEGTHARSGV